MSLKRFPPVLCLLAACFFMIPSLEAAPRRRAGGFRQGYEFNPYLTFTDFDSKSEIEDEIGVGFRFGYLYNTNHEIEFLFNGVSTNDEFLPSDTVDVSQFQVAYVFNFTSHDVVPYFTAGVGFMHVDDSDLGDETNPVFGVGGGVRFFFGPVVYARFELRHNMFEGDGTVFVNNEDFSYNEVAFGFGWRLPSY